MNDAIMTLVKPKVESIQSCVRDQELTLQIHTDERVFLTLNREWEKLARLSNQMICMSSEWAASWWKYFGRQKNRSLFIVTVYDNHKLVAILPFYKGATTFGGITIQRRLQLIGSGGSANEQLGFSDDYGISDFLDLIVDPEYRIRTAELCVRLLLSQELSDHQITFHESREDSYIMKTIYPLLKDSKRRVREEHTDTCFYIDVAQKADFQDFIKKSKSNARRRFRQTLRARGIENEFIIEEPSGPAEVEIMIGKLIQLHQNRWNKSGYPGVFEDERFREFFMEISFNAYRDKKLWLKQAVDEGGVCAVRMLLMYNSRYYDYMSGYDDDSPSAKYRPGIGLLLDLIENSFEKPIERIELLRGDESYKEDFTELALKNWKITITEIRNWKSGWGLTIKMLQLCSIIYKYFNREKKLLKVQYRKAGIVNMISGYLKFRLHTLLR
ncbi:MAG: GNAT family N-acetyltransferase [Balneolaceae bacterium]